MFTAKYFEESLKNDIKILALKPSERDDFLASLPAKFRLCYISDKKLTASAKKTKISKEEFVRNFLLPDRGSVMSGDFGELLCYVITKDHFKDAKFKVGAPKKWRWKQDSKKPAPHTDILIFKARNLKSKNNNPKDELIAVEAKMKAGKNKSYDPIQNAVEGANKDKLSRMSKSLQWYYERYAKEGKPTAMELVNKFRNPDTYGSFKRSFKAIAVIDENLFNDELSKDIDNLDSDVEIWAISIDKLKDAYEKVFDEIPNSV